MLFFGKILFLLVHLCAATEIVSKDKIIFCYWGTWGFYYSGDGKFAVDDIDPHLCTHICYRFIGITENGMINLLDNHLDSDLQFIEKTVALKKINPNLKTIAGLGSLKEGSEKYSAIAANSANRTQFISSAVDFLQRHGFDGMDLRWKYPTQPPLLEDCENYITLLKEIKLVFNSHNYLIMSRIGPAERLCQQSYNIREMFKALDLINVLTHDFRGTWTKPLGHTEYTAAASMEYWISQGAPPSKIVMSIPLFGRSYTMPPLENLAPSANGLHLAIINARGFLSVGKPINEKSPQYDTKVGAPSAGPGLPGSYAKRSGLLNYNEFCSNLSDWTTEWDEVGQVPFSYKGNQWITYENELSIVAKVKFIKEQNLAGAVVWSIEMDDFRGNCKRQKFPLLRAINSLLK